MNVQGILNQQQDNRNPEHEVWQDIEAAGLVLFVFWVIRRIRTHHHMTSGVVLLVSSVGALLVMMNFDMTSDTAYLFWSLVAVAILSLAKVIS